MAKKMKRISALLLSAIMIFTGLSIADLSFAEASNTEAANKKAANPVRPLAEPAEGMENNGITIEKAEFCRNREKAQFGYPGIYGFMYLRLKGAPEGARYRLTRTVTAGEDKHNYYLVGMPPAHHFGWQFLYNPGDTVDFKVYDNKGETELAEFKNVPLRIIDYNKPIDSPLEDSDGGLPELTTCDFYSGFAVESTSAENPEVVEHPTGDVYIRVKNIENAAKFDIETLDKNDNQWKHSSKKAFIGNDPDNMVHMDVSNNSFLDTKEEQKNKAEFPIKVNIYDKDDQLIHTFENVTPRIVSKYDTLMHNIKQPNGAVLGGLLLGQLKLLVNKSYQVNVNDYTKETADVFVAAREVAEKLLENMKGTQKEVNVATYKLFEAKKALKLKSGPITPQNTWEFNKVTKTLIKYNGTDKNLLIPDNFDGVAVENIGDNAFNSKELLEVKIPAGVKKIGKRAFSHNSLSKVVVPGSVERIEEGAFSDNDIQTLEFTAPASIKYIGAKAFLSNALKDVTIPSSIENIDEYAFASNLFENYALKIDSKEESVTFKENALDNNGENKNLRVYPKFLKDPAGPVTEADFKILCAIEEKSEAEQFSIKIINKSTNTEYQPIKKESTPQDPDFITYTFKIPAGAYKYKENEKFFAICDCGKPLAEKEKVLNFNGKPQSAPSSTIRFKSWKYWNLVEFELVSETTLKPGQASDPNDPDCILRAIVKEGASLVSAQIPKLDIKGGYEFTGWKYNGKSYTDEELRQYKPTENMKFVASVKKKGGNPPGPTPGGGGSGGGGISPGPAPNPGNPQTPAKDNNIDKGTKGEQEIKFIDVKDNSWAKEAIMYVAKKGIFKGVSSDRFNPNGNVDRAMFVTALARYFKGEGKSAVTFKDVSSSSYYANAVAWAVENKIVNGISKDMFGSTAPITREQIAAILDRAITVNNKVLKDETAKGNASELKDLNNVSGFAKASVEKLVSMGILTGKSGNMFAPKDTLTRAEAAAIFHRLDTLLK